MANKKSGPVTENYSDQVKRVRKIIWGHNHRCVSVDGKPFDLVMDGTKKIKVVGFNDKHAINDAVNFYKKFDYIAVLFYMYGISKVKFIKSKDVTSLYHDFIKLPALKAFL